MFTFHDPENDTVIQPTLELETTLPLPIKLVNEIDRTFMVRLSCDTLDMVLKNSIYRITPEFRFRISPDVASSTRPNTTRIYSATKEFFDMVEQLFKLEPCFKVKPPADISPEALRQLLLESTCQCGFLEITSLLPNPSFEEILINSPEIFHRLELDHLENINRILIYDIGKNCSIIPKPGAVSVSPVPKAHPLDESTYLRYRRYGLVESHRPLAEAPPFSGSSCSTVDPSPPAASNIHANLIKIIMSYLEQKVSTRFVQNLSMNREKIFRSAATPETIGEAFDAIGKSLSLIKTDQRRQ
ncbi:MAG: hypothetical protein M1469_01465 [Bacteroidetes bacterium]|nr:hypothetical protein [Bacteroidota bacterium]